MLAKQHAPQRIEECELEVGVAYPNAASGEAAASEPTER
jgi:hypothetical protein